MIRTSGAADELGELKAQFLSSLNHEIRTPLSGILGMLDLLLETELSGEQKEYAESSRVCAENLLDIMNSTLEFSALSANQVVLEEAEFPLRDMLETMVDDFVEKARAKKLRLIRNFDGSLPELVSGDAFRLKQLLANILENAIKFTAHGEVEVSGSAIVLTGGDALVKICVRDTGIGIPSEKLDSIFDSFRQVDGGLSRRYTGMGLGLAVTQKLAKLMHAELSVSSELDRGSVFSLTIPLRAVQDRPPRVRETSNLFRILVVDPNLQRAMGAAHVLHRRAYQVDCASTAGEALEAVDRAPYDLILIDMEAPGADSAQLIECMRLRRLHVDVPVVALSSGGWAECFRTCAEHGVYACLRRPVQPADLLRTVERLLPQGKRVLRTSRRPIEEIAV